MLAWLKNRLLDDLAKLVSAEHAAALKDKLGDSEGDLEKEVARISSPDFLKVPKGTPVNLYFNLGPAGAALRPGSPDQVSTIRKKLTARRCSSASVPT